MTAIHRAVSSGPYAKSRRVTASSAPGRARPASDGNDSPASRTAAARQTLSGPLNKLRHDGLVNYTVLSASKRTRAWALISGEARLTREGITRRSPAEITEWPAARSLARR